MKNQNNQLGPQWNDTIPKKEPSTVNTELKINPTTIPPTTTQAVFLPRGSYLLPTGNLHGEPEPKPMQLTVPLGDGLEKKNVAL